jgi:phenylacetate-CoA ligase
MADETTIPDAWRRRSPLMTEGGWRTLQTIQQHADAPRWSYTVGDRVEGSDLAPLDDYRRRVMRREGAQTGPTPSAAMLDWVRAQRAISPIFERLIPHGFDLERGWAHLPTMSREDIASRLELIVPRDADLSRVLTYDTSGTTGHAIYMPHHPRAVALGHALLEYVMARWGRPLAPRAGEVVGANLCAQAKTYIFPTIFTVWDQAGFVKVNLRESDWSTGRAGAGRFLQDMAPQFITGDPVTFAELLDWDLKLTPNLLISTAVQLSPGLAARVSAHVGAPVVDWYSMTETGPIAYQAPGVEGLHILPPDLHVEILDEDGFPAAPGERGEIVVTGGRNPYLPLLRYRTGDHGRMAYGATASDVTPRILELEGRGDILFRGADGRPVKPIDIGRTLRQRAVFVQHQLTQRLDGSCELVIRPAPNLPVDTEEIAGLLRELFGPGTPVTVRLDARLGEGSPGGKVMPFVQERGGATSHK